MHIAGSADRFLELLSQLDDPAVQIPQILFILDRAVLVPDHKRIIANGLDLQVIIEIHDSSKF